jgi:hypothetical protein
MSRYLFASFLGGLIGAGCVLVAVYVTNTKALVVTAQDVNDAVTSLHSRINDFYIFAGIVITLLLAINVGVYIKADEEVDRQISELIKKHEKKIERMNDKRKKMITELKASKND